MNIEFIHPTSSQHQGQRDYQEDRFHSDAQILLVADGVGGHQKGDRAAEIVRDTWVEIELGEWSSEMDLDYWIEHVITSILDRLWEYAIQHPEAIGMGSTLAMVIKDQGQLYSIHIGDSRIYHFDSTGRIKWRSKDHSFVQELMDAEIITPEVAKDHPKRNVITRVLQAKKRHQVKADITQLVKVEKGDFILVCSDGVTESWTDEGLSALIGSTTDTGEIIKEIMDYCRTHSNDNHTAILAQIDRSNSTDIAATSSTQENKNLNVSHKKSSSKWSWFLFFVIIAFGGYFWISSNQTKSSIPENPAEVKLTKETTTPSSNHGITIERKTRVKRPNFPTSNVESPKITKESLTVEIKNAILDSEGVLVEEDENYNDKPDSDTTNKKQ